MNVPILNVNFQFYLNVNIYEDWLSDLFVHSTVALNKSQFNHQKVKQGLFYKYLENVSQILLVLFYFDAPLLWHPKIESAATTFRGDLSLVSGVSILYM